MSAWECIARAGTRGVRLWVEGDQLRYAAPSAQALDSEMTAELRSNRAEIIRLLRSVGKVPERRPIVPVTEGEPCPLSAAQQRFFFLGQLDGESSSYNLSSAFLLEGELDVSALEASIHDIVARHHILRTRFVASGSGLAQIVTDWTPSVPLTDLSSLPAEERWAAFEEFLHRESSRPFNVSDGPHVRANLVRLAAHRHALLVDMHHLVSDGGSIAPFVADLEACYRSRSGGKTPRLPPLALQYRDFARWQLSSPGLLEDELDYWRKTLAGAPALLQLPLDRPRPAVQSFPGATVCVRIDPELENKLDAWRTRFGFTSFHCLLAAFLILLHKYSRQDDLVAGTPVSNRPQEELANLIGPFLNMVAVRARISANATLHGFIEQVRQSAIAAIENSDVPFQDVVAAIETDRSASYSPIFNVMFVLEDTPVGIFKLPGLKVTTLTVPSQAAKYDLTLVVQRDPQGLNGWLKFNSDLFDASTVERLGAHYLNVLRNIAEEPEQRIDHLCVLSPAERRRQLEEWNNTARPYPSARPVHHFFEEQAEKQPNAIALDFENRTLTYAETNQGSNALAHFLAGRGVGPESIVAIRAERSIEMLLAVLGVLKAGASYVPIDPEYPAPRQEFMVADACAPLLLTQRRFASDGAGGSRTVVIEDVLEDPQMPRHNLAPRAGPDCPAYVIYTSGSTGTPKGVVTAHRAIANNLLWMQDNWPIGPADVFLLKAAFSFDVSFKEMLWPLMFGARLVIAAPGGHKDPAYLHATIAVKNVTVIHLVPTMLDYFLIEARARSAASLRIVMCGGEALSAVLKSRFCDAYDAALLHLYGPTEAAIAVTGILYQRGDQRPITLGRPTANCQIFILDAGMNPLPVGAPGEIYIGGVGLARGYHRRPELTAEKFLPDPFSGRPGARLYRTGDLARFLPDGDIQFLGRVDEQVKIRGLRLELGEVENALRQHPAVADCLVDVHTDASGVKRLAACVVFGPNEYAGGHELAAFLRGRLPGYMIPAAYTPIAGIPISPNGKADRSALPPPSFAGMENPDRAEPSNAAERTLLTLWRETLGVETIGVRDHFFEAGGSSIALLQLQQKIEEAFGRSVRIPDLFEHPTIAEMARLLSDRKREPETTVRVPQVRAIEDEPIALIGMACRFPGAGDLDEFWELIRSGREAIRVFSEEELLADGYPPELIRQPNFVMARGYVEGLDGFDPEFFRYTPAEALILEPQVRLLLELTQHAFDNAGHDPQTQAERGNRVGVFVSASRSSYYLNHLQPRRDLLQALGATQLAIATDKSFIATHIAYRFDFRGPAMAIDTACSSSLVAVHQACAALLRNECDAAVAGGASIDAPLKGGYPFLLGGIGSPDGHCRPFDAQACGTVKGMGGGVVLLKRLSQAIADGDHIYAVLRSSAVNNDGGAKMGFTAPSPDGQAAAIEQAWTAAGLNPEQIVFLETHGTGTALGDPIEFAALARVFERGQIALGAVKANIGHLDAAAGIAGLIKTSLVLQRKEIPPLALFREPNPEIALERSPFYIPRESRPWAESGQPRRAGVSSFGIGGTNAHVVLEEAPPRAPAKHHGVLEQVTVSARSQEQLQQFRAQIAFYLQAHPELALPDVAYTLRSRRRFEYRRTIECRSLTELIRGLSARTLHDPPSSGIGSNREQGACRRVPLPGCIFDRRRFWIDPPAAAAVSSGAKASDPAECDGAMSSAQRKVARVWREAIGVSRLGLDEDFFSIGGDSLAATQLAARLGEVFECSVSPKLIYDEPTIRGLADLLEGISGVRARSATAGSSLEREEIRI